MRAIWTLVKHETGRFFEVANNTIIPPMISALLYFLIFGVALGSRISQGNPTEYLRFLLPGLILMQLVIGSYSNPSGSLYMGRLLGYINDVLLSSLSYSEMVVGFIIGGIVRGATLGVAVWVISLLFVVVVPLHPFLLIVHILLTTVSFAGLGIIIGLWAKRHDQLNILMNFAITPLVFLGGVFYSIQAIPKGLQIFTRINPIFYMVNGVRYSMIGTAEAPIWLGIIILSGMAAAFLAVDFWLFKKGWGLRT